MQNDKIIICARQKRSPVSAVASVGSDLFVPHTSCMKDKRWLVEVPRLGETQKDN